jgi:hypothetical protein
MNILLVDFSKKNRRGDILVLISENRHKSEKFVFKLAHYIGWSWDSPFGIAAGYGLNGRGLIPVRGQDFSLLHIVQTDCVAHPASYPMGAGCPFHGGKATEA